MNRSILIVICDFIITSMIYLNGGFSAIESPFQDGGGATIDRSAVNVIISELEKQRDELEKTRQALIKAAAQSKDAQAKAQQADKISIELAQVRSKLEFMERRARLNREESGPQTPAAVQKELEEEIRQKNLARAKYEQLAAELAASKENLQRNDKNLTALRQQHNALIRELAVRSASLENTQNKLSKAAGEVARLSERLTARDAEIKHKESDLAGTRKELANVRLTAQGYRRKITKTENELAFLRGRSNAMEKELASVKDRLLTSEKNIKAREIELASAQTRLENMQNVLKNAVRDLTATRTRLAGESADREQAQTQLAKLKGDYNAVNVKLQNAESKLRSDVLKRYSQSAVKLNYQLRESRLLKDRFEVNEKFLPAISIHGKNYLISALQSFAGLRRNSAALDNVSELSYTASPAAGDKAAGKMLDGPIFVGKGDCRVALLETPSTAVQPLTIITKDALKRRGIHDLYLFKTSSFGKDSTILDSRCSMSFDSDDDYLYIRNGARVSSELKADVGDLVLTKQGELAAIVVALENYDFDRQQEARCYVFNSLPEVKDLPQISLKKLQGQKDYREFSDKLNFWLEQAEQLNVKKRRR
ncbi:MAG: hypothetical protein IKD10_01300 [Lentisphaeria bacterium]|nr:hypothetical protein [Lentisphaeria bacterium]